MVQNHSFRSVLRQVNSFFQNEFYQCGLVLPLSICTILSFPYSHPVADYFFFLFCPSLLSFLLSFLQ